jgi:uncharacterized protein YjbI with pentapeptide repeats
MKNVTLASVSCALLATVVLTPAFAEDSSCTSDCVCAEWKSHVAVNMEALDKLKKNAASEKPAAGMSYTKNQLVVLLGKNLVAAKDALANYKDKLPKTGDGKIDLRDVTLNGFVLTGLNLDNVDFKGAEMNGVDLSGSSLNGAILTKTELEGANLSKTNLSFASLTKTKLASASLCLATLTSADLEDAILKGAYLKGAKLDMAKNIPKVIYLNAQSVLHFGLPVPAE